MSSERGDLTPLDIRYQEFRLGLRGYSVAEVREYLGRVADVQTALIEENERLRSHIRDLEAELARSREGEAELKRAVVAAERIAREIKAQAEREAELIKRETESERQAALQELIEQMKRIKADIEQVRNERDLFVGQFRALLEGYLTSLDRFKR
ncbi:MAG: DivIVA domain-containing protein [Meiothermus sp.]|uniref:DivIVA domain-containing protein n=1 Tax=Meiothermus sp. TaxID=1955249 RepID=UPI0025EBD57B|nr:DivIVA domain-containing protein [Meiothermus sp.]MCS7067609.1 DivIVA domain-containing protein [Meiothermus sp.]MCX7602261.1 DivIVA domain-containing protein [Meiothermus sp.]MDW8424362.1 DivIVA domain-containing protein [Meiothermus sp.]